MNPDVIRGLSAPLDMPDEEDKSAFNKLKSQKPPSKRNGNKARAFFHNATQRKKKRGRNGFFGQRTVMMLLPERRPLVILVLPDPLNL